MAAFKPTSAFALNATTTVATGNAPAIVVDRNAAIEAVFARNQQRLINAGADINVLKQEVAQQVTSFNPRDSKSVSELGSSAGKRISDYSEKLLSNVRSSDVDGVGDKLHEVVMLAKGINVSDFVNKNQSKIPVIGSIINRFRMGKEQLLGKYDSLQKQIDKLVTEMKTTQNRLVTRVGDLEKMYELNVVEYYNLEQVLLIGEVKMEELKMEIEAMKASPTVGDPMEAQRLSDTQNIYQRLEKRVHDLRTMQMVAIQTAPQIRLIQSNNQVLVDKFNNLQELTIPNWKKQFTLAVSLMEQKKAVELATKIDDTTNDLMKQNAELLKLNSIATARANERSVVDIETLEHVQQSLIATIEEVDQIRRDGEQNRITAVKRMEEMKEELMQKVINRT